jgi:hypothetical protein
MQQQQQQQQQQDAGQIVQQVPWLWWEEGKQVQQQ